MTTSVTAKNRKTAKRLPCVECAGLGERDTSNCTCRECNPGKRSAIRAIFDGQGRWMIHWRETDGEEWVGTYRLTPC